jgi:hypothetical protein
MDFEERLSRLEQSNRRLKQLICLLALIPFGIFPLMGAGREEKIDVLTVRELIFKDDKGTVRGRIVADQRISQIFYAANGKERYHLAVGEPATFQFMYDNKNRSIYRSL